MWGIYDELIALIPENLEVKGFLAGLHWFLVRSEGTGMAMSLHENLHIRVSGGMISGTPVKETAQKIKAWSNFEASIGLAAINSVVNAPCRVTEAFGTCIKPGPEKNIFERMKDRISGKKVAAVGHFRNMEQIAPVCELSILERLPEEGDLPDPACEYILPEQDYVFITASALINKTLPRLLELSRNAFVILQGPSTPLTPCLFKYGIDMLAGTVVLEHERVWNLIQEGGRNEFFGHGTEMVEFMRP